MASPQHEVLIGLIAYLAAGIFYVLRGLSESSSHGARLGDLRGLIVVALCWAPITLTNLCRVRDRQPWPALMSRAGRESLPPLILFAAIVTTATHLSP